MTTTSISHTHMSTLLTVEDITSFVSAVKSVQKKLINTQLASLKKQYNKTSNSIQKLHQNLINFKNSTNNIITQQKTDTETLEVSYVIPWTMPESLDKYMLEEHAEEQGKLAALQQKIQALVNTSRQLQVIVSSLPDVFAPNAITELNKLQVIGFANLPNCITVSASETLARTSTIEDLQSHLKALNTETHYQHTGLIGTILKFIEQTLGLKLSVKTATEKTLNKTTHTLWQSAAANKSHQNTTFDAFLDTVKSASLALLKAAAMGTVYSKLGYVAFT